MGPDDLELDPLFAEDGPTDLSAVPPMEDGDTLHVTSSDPQASAAQAATAAKDAAFKRYIDGGKYALNDIVHATEKGWYFVCDFWPDGKPKFRHRVRPNPKFAKGAESPNPLGKHAPAKDTAAYIREQTGNGAELYDFFLKVMRDGKAALKDRLWAAEKLTVRAFGKIPTAPDPKKPDEKNPLAGLAVTHPEALPKITFSQLAKLNEALRGIGLDPANAGGAPGGADVPADDAAVQPAPADDEAGDVP